MSADDTWLLAEKALDRREYREAETLYRRALASSATHVPALIGLSTVLSRLGRHRDAHAAAIAAHDARPTAAPLVYAVAQRLRYFHEFDRLVACLSPIRFAGEAPPDIVAKAAVMLSSIGAHDAALAMAEAGIARAPANAALLHVLGNFRLFSGRSEEARGCYEASLRSDPLLFQNSLMLAGIGPIDEQHNHVERLKSQLRTARPGGNGEVYLSFALHKELHELGRHEEAWHALERGCAAKRRQIEYRPEADAALVAALEARCDAAFVRAGSSIVQPHIPIFIIGMHRSGTTLLERMLSGHPLVGDAGETSAFHAEMELATDLSAPAGPTAELVMASGSVDFDEVARGYARRARWLSRGKPFFTEKLPQNFLNVGFIARALPQAKFLHLVRDPMDTCFSNLRQLFSGAALYSYDQTELADFYLLYRRTMAHWRKVLPGRVLDIPYEQLVADPEGMARRVADYCGLGFEPGMVNLQRPGGTVSTPSTTVARTGFRRDRGAVWRCYERYLTTLLDRLAPAYAQEGGAPPTVTAVLPASRTSS